MSTKKLIALALITVVTCTGAIIHGRTSQRWGTDRQMVVAGQKLSSLDVELPGWELKSVDRISETSRTMLETTGDLVQTFREPITGAMLNVSVVVGPPGTISVHSPEVCLPSRNYELLGRRKEIVIRDAGGVEHRLWKVTFESQDASARLLHVYYGWSAGAAWSAPDSPRYTFVGSPYLYKIQVAGYVSPEDPGDEYALGFLREYLPAVSRELVSVTSSQLPSHDEE